MDDPIVNQVREARQRIFAECSGDLERLLDRFQSVEKDLADRLVTADEIRARRPVAGPDKTE